MKKIFYTFTLLIIIFFTCLPSFTLAEDESPGYEIEVAIPGGPITGTEVSLAEYIKYIYIFGLSLIGIAALGVLVYGGLMYMLSDTVVSKDDAKKYIWAAISGLILGLAAFLILNTINPDLTSLTLPELNDLSELKEPVPPTDCTEDASVCSESERCDKISEDKSVCKSNCTKECTTYEEKSCVPKEDGEKCSTGLCEGGECKPPNKDCMTINKWGCTNWPSGCCEPNVCSFNLCTAPKEPNCETKGCVVGGTECCEGLICIKGGCKEKALTCEAGNCDSGCKTTANCEAWQDWNNNKCECENVL